MVNAIMSHHLPSFAAIDHLELDSVTGGVDDFELGERLGEKNVMRAWEKRHPIKAIWCQGDRACILRNL